MLLIAIILALALLGGGGGYYGYSRWGSRGGLAIVGTVLVIVDPIPHRRDLIENKKRRSEKSPWPDVFRL